jgi:hypothetical protein
MCEVCLFSFFKAVTQACLRRIMAQGISDLRFLLDLHVLMGYDTALNRTDPMATVFEEFCTPAGSRDDTSLRRYIRKAINNMSFRPIAMSFEQFVAFRDAWANPGSSTLGKSAELEVTTKKKGRLTRKVTKLRTKWFKALSFSDARLAQLALEQSGGCVVRPFLKKDEPAKARTVQSFDTLSILRTSYLLEGLKSYNGKCVWTTLEMTQEEKAAMRRQVLAKDGHVRVCTDQSSFDINQSKENVLYAVEYLFSRISQSASRDVSAVVNAELANLRSSRIVVGNKVYPWKKGVLSGMKLTALIDSILNYAATYAALDSLKLRTKWSFFQGDDAVVCLRSKEDFVDVRALARTYARFGLVVNPDKTWVAKDRCEFLHEIYDGTVISAFPARTAKTLIWHKPVLSVRSSGAAAVNEDLESFRVAGRRGLVGLFKLGLKVVKNGTRQKVDDALFRAAWRTPVVLGGFGFGCDGRVRCELKSEKKSVWRCRVVSPIGYQLERHIVTDAAIRRAESVASLPGFKTTMLLQRVPSTLPMSRGKAETLSGYGKPRLTWELRDYRFVPDPYTRKLNFEFKLSNNCEISSTDVPTNIFRGLADEDKSIRMYARLSRYGFNLSGSRLHSEQTCISRRWAEAVWNGVCMRHAMLKGMKVDVLWTSLVKAVWQMVLHCPVMLTYRL